MLRSIRSSQHGGKPVGGEIEKILRKLGKLNIIESQLNEMHAKITNIEETECRLDREVKSSKNTTKKPEKCVGPEDAIQYSGVDISEIECQLVPASLILSRSFLDLALLRWWWQPRPAIFLRTIEAKELRIG